MFSPKLDAQKMTEISIYNKQASIYISPHFNLKEFACKCDFEECKVVLFCQKVAEILEKLRDRLNKPILITSGYRCPRYNQQVGGAPESTHITGYGVDIFVPDIKLEKLAHHARSLGFLGIGIYKSHIHVDIYKDRQWTSDKA